MKTTTTAKTEEVKARVQSEQSFRAPEGEFHKYIVLRWQGREQVTVFPFSLRHAEVFRFMKRECPELEAISAGFFIVDNGAVWTTGNSESLSLSSRPQVRRLVLDFQRQVCHCVVDKLLSKLR